MATGAGSLRVFQLGGDEEFLQETSAIIEGTEYVTEVMTSQELQSAVTHLGKGEVDAIVCSGTDGVAERVRKLRDRNGDIPVIVVADVDEALTAVEAGATEYYPRVTRDEQYEFIAARLDALANGQPAVPESASPSHLQVDADHGGESPSDLELEEQFQLVTEFIDEVVFITRGIVSDPTVYEEQPADTGVEYISPGFEELWGRSPAAAYEDPGVISDGIHPDDRARYQDSLAEMAADAEAGDVMARYTLDCRVQRPDGQTRWVATTTIPVPTEESESYRWVGTIRDITARKEREQALEERERTYREVFENVTDGLVVHDVETGEIVDVNERFCEMNRYTRDELVGADIGIVTADDPAYTDAKAESRIEQAFQEGPQLFEWQNQRKTGEEFPVEVHLAVVRIDGEDRVLASVRDITERKEREREIREAEERFRLVTEHIDEVIFVTRGLTSMDEVDAASPDRRDVEYLSPAFEDIFHRPVEAVYDDPGVIREAVIPEDRDEYQGMLESMVEDVNAGDVADSYRAEYRIERDDGTRRWLQTTAYPAATGAAEEYRWVGIIEDVTARHRREAMMRELHRSTERLQETETPTAVCEAAVEVARSVLNLPMTACWFHDASRGVLEPITGTDPVLAMEKGPDPFEPGDVEYDAFQEGNPLVYDPSEYHPHNPLDAAIMLPLGEHGLLAAGAPGVTEYEPFLIDAARTLAEHVETALERAIRADELRESERRFRQIAERIDEIIYLTDSELEDILYVNPAFETVYGRSVDALYADPEVYSEAVHPADREAFEAEFSQMIAEITAGDPRSAYEFEFRIQRPDGEVRWLETTGYPVRDATDEIYRVVGISKDITEEKQHERTVETLGDATTTLHEASSRDEIAEIAVRAGEEVLDFSLMAVYLHDEADGTLRPAAQTSDAEEILDEPPVLEGGESLAWQVFVEGEPMYVEDVSEHEDAYRTETPFRSELLLPLGPHGVIIVSDQAPAEFTESDRQLARLLAANVEAALNWARGRQRLEEHERELEEQSEQMARLDRLNEVIRDIEQATIEESTRDDIESAVCERLAAVESYGLVWIGEPDVASGRVVPRNREGEEGYRDSLDVVLDETARESHPAWLAVETEEPQTVGSIVNASQRGEWRSQALSRGYGSCCAVPIRYDDVVHGVLMVYAEEPGAFEDHEATVLVELGRSIGYAITALERKRALESDTTTELEFDAWDADLLFVAIAEAAGCRVQLERSFRRTDGSISTFYSVADAAPSAVADTVRTAVGAADAEVITDDGDAGLIEVQTDSWFGSVFADHGAGVRSATASADGEGALVVELPRETDTRTVVESFQREYPATDLVAKRERARSARTPHELRSLIEENMTDRQQEVLETAYAAGYFEWPRESSGEEVAELLDITQPTLNKHLRAAERKSFTLLLDEDSDERRDAT